MVEIETHINHILKFIQIANLADRNTVQTTMRKLQLKFKEEKFA